MKNLRVLFFLLTLFGGIHPFSFAQNSASALAIPFTSDGDELLTGGKRILAVNFAGPQTWDEGTVHRGPSFIRGIPFRNIGPNATNPVLDQQDITLRIQGQDGAMGNTGMGVYHAPSLDRIYGGGITSEFGDPGGVSLKLLFSGLRSGTTYRLQTFHRQGEQTDARGMVARLVKSGDGVVFESGRFAPMRDGRGRTQGLVHTLVWTASGVEETVELLYTPGNQQKGRVVLNALILHENPELAAAEPPPSPASQLWMPAVFGDHMAIQAGKSVALWGRARPGEAIRARFTAENGDILAESPSVRTGADRQWRTELPPLPPGSRGRLEILAPESGDRTFEDVVAGEVWVLSGQSNMRWTVAKSNNAEAEIAAAEHPGIRLFITSLQSTSGPQNDLGGFWQVCSPETVGDFSGPGYSFGRKLHQTLNVPVGMILSAVGGTPIQSWTPMAAMDAHPATAHIRRDFEAYRALPPGQRPQARGTSLYGAREQFAPARLYNGMIHPLTRLTIRGIAWCQGEANSRETGRWDGPSVYRHHFPLLIQSWREQWGRADLPFLYIELASFMAPQQDPVDAAAEHNWAYIREAQAEALKLGKVFFASAIDIGEADEIHYGDKQTAGHRLALAALGGVYGAKDIPWQSPVFREHVREGARIRLRFDHAAGLRTRDGQPPRTFAIQARGGEWTWAEAEIAGDDIVVWHPEISEPSAVRHAWASHPDVNVTNAAGLPLSSFRTDHPEQGN